MVSAEGVLTSRVVTQMQFSAAVNLVFEVLDSGINRSVVRSMVFDNSWCADAALSLTEGSVVAFRGWAFGNTDIIDLTYLCPKV